MILICLICAADMLEIQTDSYICPCCGFEAEQLTIERADNDAKQMDRKTITKEPARW